MELEVRTGNGKLLFKWNPDTSTLSIVQKSPPLDHVHGRNRPPSRSGRPVHITAKTPW